MQPVAVGEALDRGDLGALPGDRGQATMDEVGARGPAGSRAGQREHDLQLPRVGMPVQQVCRDERCHARPQTGVHEHGPASSAGNGTQRASGRGRQRGDVDQRAAPLEDKALGQEGRMRNGIYHELVVAQRGRDRLETVEIHMNLARPRLAGRTPHVPAGLGERPGRELAEHTSNPDDQYTLGWSALHGVSYARCLR